MRRQRGDDEDHRADAEVVTYNIMTESRRWYLVELPRAHQGTGHSHVDECVAIRAYDVAECQKRIQRIPSYKRYWLIREAAAEECDLIARVIDVTPAISRRKAKREWVFLFADVVEQITKQS